jgi:hypothetical protein
MDNEPQTPAAPPAGNADDTSTPGGSPTTPSEPQAGDDTTISLDEAKKLRSEAANLRKRLKSFEDADAQRQAASLTEQEKLQKQLADLQSAREADIARALTAEISLTAAELGVAPQYLKRVAHMLDWEELELGDDGEPKNIKALIETLIKEMPPGFTVAGGARPASQAGGATNPARSQTGQFAQITRDNQAEAMQNYQRLPTSQQLEVQRLLTRGI